MCEEIEELIKTAQKNAKNPHMLIILLCKIAKHPKYSDHVDNCKICKTNLALDIKVPKPPQI